MLEVEHDLEPLGEYVLALLDDLRARRNIDILEFILLYQVWEVHVYLRDYSFSLEIVDGKPIVLSGEVAVWILHHLRKDQWSLDAIIILESHSFMEDFPSVVLGDYLILSIRWNGTRYPELEQLDAWCFSLGILICLFGDFGQEQLAGGRDQALVPKGEVLCLGHWQERFAFFGLPIAATQHFEMRGLR